MTAKKEDESRVLESRVLVSPGGSRPQAVVSNPFQSSRTRLTSTSELES